MQTLKRILPVLIVLLAAAGHSAIAQSAERTADLLPADPESWINSKPITAEMLKGKAALLWFFEET